MIKTSKEIKPELVSKINTTFSKYLKKNPNPSTILYFYKTDDLTITIFSNMSLLLQGSEQAINDFVDLIGSKYKNKVQKLSQIKQAKTADTSKESSFDGIVGCDEVGTGDYFGPVVTCACYVDKKDELKIKSFGVKDSKELTDVQIVRIFETIKKIAKYKVCVCKPKTYNNMIKKYENSNIVKTVCHNETIDKLLTDISGKNFQVVMDQFVNSKNYYAYLEKLKLTPSRIDVFVTKAESKYISVAAASIIARAYFVREMEKLSEKAGVKLPLGASSNHIVHVGKKIKTKFDLEDFAKIHFESITAQIFNKKD